MLEKLRGTSLRRRVIIVFISQTGAQEAGVDSGGLLREFVSELCARAFSPAFGLFTRTPDGLLYPNPAARLAHQNGDHLRLFSLLGAMLGKAVFEGIVIDALFAPFFLGALRGRQQFFHVLDDVRQLDAEVHKNLAYLRNSQEDVEALGLTFTVARDDFGAQEEVELVARGRDMAVTAANKFLYVQLVAKHYIVDRLAPQTQAFVQAFHSVVPPAALQSFSEPELQILVSGSLAGIDVADMRRHAQYGGGYTSLDRHVRRLWEALGSLSQEELSLFLQFVTSSRRAPTGGFGQLNPPLTIVRVPIRRDDERLPVGRTCFNQLLWPVRRDNRVPALGSCNLNHSSTLSTSLSPPPLTTPTPAHRRTRAPGWHGRSCSTPSRRRRASSLRSGVQIRLSCVKPAPYSRKRSEIQKKRK
jgi:hypothetical protein